MSSPTITAFLALKSMGKQLDKKIYDNFVMILKDELVPALGCTEPIAIAYAAAKAREVLGQMPESMEMCWRA